jgi:hypothetical protein
MVKEDRHVHLKLICKELGITYGSFYGIVRDSFGVSQGFMSVGA